MKEERIGASAKECMFNFGDHSVSLAFNY